MNTWTDKLEAYSHWRVNESNGSMNTWLGERPGLTQFCSLMDLHAITMDNITTEHAAYWWESISHLRSSTRSTRLSQVRSFIHYCMHRQWMHSDPTALLRAKVEAAEPRLRLTAQQLLNLVDAADNRRDRILLALAVNLGVRGGEISRLRMMDVNMTGDEIVVHVDKTNEIDIMPINSDLKAELAVWMTHYHHETPGLNGNHFLVPSVYVGPSASRYRPDRPYTEPYRAVQASLRRLGFGIEPGEGVHTVRRSVAAIYFDMVEAEESFDSALLATMVLLHHARPETTLKYIGRDRATLARDRIMRGKPFLRKLVGAPTLRAVTV